MATLTAGQFISLSSSIMPSPPTPAPSRSLLISSNSSSGIPLGWLAAGPRFRPGGSSTLSLAAVAAACRAPISAALRDCSSPGRSRAMGATMGVACAGCSSLLQGPIRGPSQRRRCVAAEAASGSVLPSEVEVKKPLLDAKTVETTLAAIGAFASLLIVILVDRNLAQRGLLGCFHGALGASAFILFGLPSAPAAKRSVVLSAYAGASFLAVLTYNLLGSTMYAKAASVAATAAFMLTTGNVHPPAAGLPLIFMATPAFQSLNWWFILFPSVFSALILIAVAQVMDYLRPRVTLKVCGQ